MMFDVLILNGNYITMRNGKYNTSEGSQQWYDNDELHREDGPAIITSHGSHHWYYRGYLHRDDGPAVILPDGRVEYWQHGVKVSEVEMFAKGVAINLPPDNDNV